MTFCHIALCLYFMFKAFYYVVYLSLALCSFYHLCLEWDYCCVAISILYSEQELESSLLWRMKESIFSGKSLIWFIFSKINVVLFQAPQIIWHFSYQWVESMFLPLESGQACNCFNQHGLTEVILFHFQSQRSYIFYLVLFGGSLWNKPNSI